MARRSKAAEAHDVTSVPTSKDAIDRVAAAREAAQAQQDAMDRAVADRIRDAKGNPRPIQ